jgi:hypothetical protein
MAYKRNYKKEYKNYQGKPAQIRARSKRNQARRKMVKLGRVKKGDNREVDHRLGIKKGNSLKNLRVLSKHNNRSFARKRDGSVKKRRP